MFNPMDPIEEQNVSIIHGCSHILTECTGASETDAWMMCGAIIVRRSVEHEARRDPERVAFEMGVPLFIVMERLIQLSVHQSHGIARI
jgi:hypothetical protein